MIFLKLVVYKKVIAFQVLPVDLKIIVSRFKLKKWKKEEF